MPADTPENATLVPAAALSEWGAASFRAVGVPDDDARLVADALVQTSLWGVDTHGIARLTHYLSRLEAGSLEARPKIAIQSTGPCTAQVDGGHGLGIAVAFAANREAVRLARENGVGVVGVGESSHCGAVGLYAREAAREGLVAFAFTHADSVVAPHGGREKYLGTNPIAIAFPCEGGEPVCLDMATSSIPWNRVMNSRRENHVLPSGVAVDEAGALTTDPHAARALIHLGGAEYGHKGYALALMIDLLCGPLNAMPFANHIPPMFTGLDQRRHLGALFIVIDPMRFAGGPMLAQTVRTMVEEMRRLPGEVTYPGAPEYKTEALRRAEGIPVEPGLLAEMRKWADKLGVAAPA